MKKILERIKYWGQLFLLPVYWFSFLFPRNKNIWLFGSTFGRRFADNPRYFFLYCSQHKDEILIGKRNKQIRPIWISRDKKIVDFLCDKGYEAYYNHSVKGIWYCLRGKLYCFDNYSKDISFWLSGGALKFNMWHGVGNKCINYDNKHDKVRHPKNAWEKFKYFPRRLSDEKPSHYILSTSPMMSEIFARAFQVPESHVIEAGYPRNDILFEDTDSFHEARETDDSEMVSDRKSGIWNLYLPEEQALMEKITAWKKQGMKIIGYLPTFRPSESKLFEVCNLQVLNHFFKEQDMMMVCKLHTKSGCKSEFEKIDYSNIYVVSAEVDVNTFLGKLDLLIADYSSVYSDYMLLNRPVVAFHYDYEEYAKDTRDAYFDWDEYMPEVKVKNGDELQQVILTEIESNSCLNARNEFKKKMFSHMDGRACERIVDILQSLV